MFRAQISSRGTPGQLIEPRATMKRGPGDRPTTKADSQSGQAGGPELHSGRQHYSEMYKKAGVASQ